MFVLVGQGDHELAKERLADLIKKLRGQRTQREFAKLLGTSYTAVQDWEKQIRLPKDVNLKRIAQLTGWTPEELVRHLFRPDAQTASPVTDPLELIITDIQNLSLEQMQKLSDYLNHQLNQAKDAGRKIMGCCLSDRQKHNLHLLLKASLKNQSPTEAMVRVGVDPELFTDIFLRNDKNRVVDYESVEKLSDLCCRVIQWRSGQLPKIDRNQTYFGEPELLFKTLAESDRVTVE